MQSLAGAIALLCTMSAGGSDGSTLHRVQDTKNKCQKRLAQCVINKMSSIRIKESETQVALEIILLNCLAEGKHE